MITSRKELVELLSVYSSSHEVEMQFVPQFLSLLEHPRSYYRDHLPGHITSSALIVNPNRSKIVMVHHAKLGKWLQPGGHADGDEDLLRVARKEVFEETGLSELKLLVGGIFDIDIHTIPGRKDFPEHLHYDIRFVFEANEGDPLIANHESLGTRWKNLDEIDQLTKPHSSIRRMIEKVVKL